MKLLALFLAHPLADLSHLWLFSETCKLVVQAFEPCLLRYLFFSVRFFFFNAFSVLYCFFFNQKLTYPVLKMGKLYTGKPPFD